MTTTVPSKHPTGQEMQELIFKHLLAASGKDQMTIENVTYTSQAVSTSHPDSEAPVDLSTIVKPGSFDAKGARKAST